MVITQAIRDEISVENGKFPRPRGGLLAALHLVQREYGRVGPEHMEELAEIFALRPIEIREVVSFYDMLSTQAGGRHRVRVCTSLSCALAGGRRLLRQLEIHLGTGADGATADGRISLAHEECPGACAAAPMMRVDEDSFEGLDLDSAKRVVDSLE
jgi:NADH-quinone oxidoreductase subunit E